MLGVTNVPFAVITFLLMVSNFCWAQNVTAEAQENSVEIKFYRLQVSEWNSKLMESKFHALLAAQANTYCRAHLAVCGLVALDSLFKDAHIGKIDNSPIDDDKDMLYQFYIEYPPNSNKTTTSSSKTVLTKSTVRSIVLQLRTDVDYISELNCERCYITYIDDDFYGIPPSSLENKIIIPIAFLILAIIIIITIALREWDKKNQKERKMIKQNLPKKKKKEPEYVMSGDAPRTTKLPDDKMPQDKLGKERMYAGSSTTTPKKQFNRTGGASNDSGLDIDAQDQVLTKHHALEPLDTGDQELKRRKKKKEKKRSKRSTKVDGIENQGYKADDEGYEKLEMKTEL